MLGQRVIMASAALLWMEFGFVSIAAETGQQMQVEKSWRIDSEITDPMEIPSELEGPVFLNGSKTPIILPPMEERLRRYLGDREYAQLLEDRAAGKDTIVVWTAPQFYRETTRYAFSRGDLTFTATSDAGEKNSVSFGDAIVAGAWRKLSRSDLDHPLFRAAVAYLRDKEGKTAIEWLDIEGEGYFPVP